VSIRRVNPLPSQCPVCGGELEVVRAHCPTCDTSIEGHFSAGRFGNLTPQQWHFVETFIRCKGKIKDVEVALDISYPTVVSRLNDVIRTLGFETADDSAGTSAADEKRRDVLDRLNQGKISAKDALRLLEGDAAE
jgi:hypothetical protein